MAQVTHTACPIDQFGSRYHQVSLSFFDPFDAAAAAAREREWEREYPRPLVERRPACLPRPKACATTPVTPAHLGWRTMNLSILCPSRLNNAGSMVTDRTAANPT